MTPYGILLTFFVLEYVRPSAYVPALNLLHLNLLTLIAAAIGALRYNPPGVKSLLEEGNSKLLLAFWGLLLISIVVSESSGLAFELARAVFEYGLLYIAIVKLADTLPRIKGVITTLVIVNILVALLTPSLITSPERQYIASGSFMGDANDYALSVNIAIALCLFLTLESKATMRIVSAVTVLFLVFVVVVTQSRGGTLALLSVGFYYWLKGANKVRTAAMVTTAVVVVLLLAPPTYWQRMNDLTNSEEGSAAGRLAAWDGGWRMALDHPIFGVGAGRFSFAYGSEYRRSITTPYQTAHSIYFLNLGELGFPGLFVLLALIGHNLIANARLGRELKARGVPRQGTERRLLASLSTAMLAYAVGGAFLSAVYYPHLYVVAGISTAGRRWIQRQNVGAEVPHAPATRPPLHVHKALVLGSRRLAV